MSRPPSGQQARGRRVWPVLLSILFIGILGVVPYINTLQTPFVFDGIISIEENPHIRIRSLDWQSLRDAAFKSHPSHRPVTHLSFALNHFFSGRDVFAYHVTNMAIHIACGLLVYLLTWLTLQRVHGPPGASTSGLSGSACAVIALMAAAVYVVHPIQTQAVTYIYQRTTMLSSLFFLSSVCLYVLGRQSSSMARRVLLWCACLLSAVLALGSKQNAAMLPVIIVMYEWFFFRNLRRPALLPTLFGVAFSVAVLWGLALFWLGDNPFDRILAGYAYRDFTPLERMLTQPRVIWLYLGLVLFPVPSRLNLLHDVDLSRTLFDPMSTLWALIGIIVLLVLATRYAARYRLLAFCVWWFFVNHVIESSIIALELAFEHRMYLPMVGVSMAFAYLIFMLCGRREARSLGVIGVLSVILGAATYSRNGSWRDGTTLWQDVVAKSPGLHRAHNALGTYLERGGDLDGALAQYREALALKPKYSPELNLAKLHLNIARVLIRKGEMDQAGEHYAIALKYQPRYALGRQAYGVYLGRIGRLDESVAELSKAARRDPDRASIHYNLGLALYLSGQVPEAITHLQRSIELDDEFADAHFVLGVAFEDQGQVAMTEKHLTRAVELDPEHALARRHLDAMPSRD